jgi:integrase
MTNYLKRCCLPLWKDRQFASITAEEIATAVRDCRNTSGKGAGRALLSAIKTLSVWAGSNGKAIGSAASIIVAKDVVGKKLSRERVLTSEELKKVWNGAALLGTPHCQVIRLLILSGCRLNEVAQAKWSEIGDLRGRCWTIPKERMKMGEAHAIPLTDMMIEVLRSLPRGTKGDCIFSVNNGKSPNQFQSRAKARITEAADIAAWVTHDLRRTMRTKCSPLGIPRHIAEEMIAHARPGVVGIYDLHEYLDEKRDGFERWNNEVARIVGWKPMIRRAA